MAKESRRRGRHDGGGRWERVCGVAAILAKNGRDVGEGLVWEEGWRRGAGKFGVAGG